MNIHHLELFYYVARHGGISEAVRKIPYGIQQPAVSGQILQLEEFLGVTLFQRRPFALTPSGDELYKFIQPFFDNLESMTSKLRGDATQHVRIGASEIVLRDHLPTPLENVRRKFPNLKVTLRTGYQPQLEAWVQKRELDLAVTVIEGKPPAGVHALPMLKLPLVLLVQKSSRLRSAEELWQQDRIEETLICLQANEAILKNFQEGLNRLEVDWFSRIEVGSLILVEPYVANGYGIGLSIAVPHAKLSPQVRALPLEGFPPVVMGALWQGKATPVIQAFLDELQKRANSLAGAEANEASDARK
ncbi:MAG: LysR family transcriptional regulator [Verrucomicrobia bacterium]|nr:LysR family transcriptional regulator [Verrucomicrobiota bacterium]